MISAAESSQKTPLKIAMDLFQSWARSRIRYCHWKSNEHLLGGLLGDTDLDVLVDRRDSGRCESALIDLGYKRIISQAGASYPGIEDWLGFDQESGGLVHIHLHYRLWTGRTYVKE